MWFHLQANTCKCNFNLPITPLSLRSISHRRGRLHELTPRRSIQSAPPCRLQAEIERAQIVLSRLNQICLGLPVLCRQSLGGPWMQARRAWEWSWLVSARQQWPKTDRRRLRVVSDRSVWSVRDWTTNDKIRPVDMARIHQTDQLSNAPIFFEVKPYLTAI